MECAAQGVIESEHVGAFKTLLQGLSGTEVETLKIHELVLKTSPSPSHGIPSSELRLQCSLLDTNPIWKVKLVGGAMRGAGAEQLVALVRSVVETTMDGNALHFLTSIGCHLDHELLHTGFAFVINRSVQIRVAVFSISAIPQLHALNLAYPLTPDLHVVEIMAPATVENYSEVVAAIIILADNLAPLVRLSKPGVAAGVVPSIATAAATIGHKKET